MAGVGTIFRQFHTLSVKARPTTDFIVQFMSRTILVRYICMSVQAVSARQLALHFTH